MKAKTGEPMGAGPYKFVKYENKVVYLEANENYWRGEPKIKYIQYKETLEPDKVSAVGTGTVDLTDPSFSDTAVKEIMGYNSNGRARNGDKIVENTVDNLRATATSASNADTVNVGGEPLSEASKKLAQGAGRPFWPYTATCRSTPTTAIARAIIKLPDLQHLLGCPAEDGRGLQGRVLRRRGWR